MATPVVTPVVAKKNGFVSFLDAVGRDFAKGLTVVLTDVSKIATAEEAPLTAINPAWGALDTQIASLSTQSLGIVTVVEQKFAAMGQQTGSGLQKFNEAVSILMPAAAQILGIAGVSLTTTTNALINGAVSILNALPAALATAAVASTPVVAAAAPAVKPVA
jgi:hypothetical protein